MGRLNVFSFYQVDGAYTHLGQPTIQVFLDTMRIASESLEYIDDPLRLQVPYDYIEARLKEPPDCLLARLAAMAAISCCFVIPVLLALYWLLWQVFRSLFHQQPCCITHTHTALATSTNSNSPFSFDTDGISFIIDNSANCIICNQRDLFVGRLSSEQVSMMTCEGETVK